MPVTSSDAIRRYAAAYKRRLANEDARDAARAREALALLPQIARRLRREHGASRVGYFGSLRTGRLREDSDVDLYVDSCEGEYTRILVMLQDMLGRRVDLVELDKAQPSLREWIEQDGVDLAGGP